MTKTFKDVFPTLKLDDEMWHLLDSTDVTKISANHDHDHIRIYLRAKRLIFKKNIWKIEEAIVLANKALEPILAGDIDAAMSRFNR